MEKKTNDSCTNMQHGFVEYLYLQVGGTTNKLQDWRMGIAGQVDGRRRAVDYISTRARKGICSMVHRIGKHSQGALSTI